MEKGTDLVKRGLAEMLKGGVIMDVIDAEQARIAEEAGAVAVMALERVPADIRKHGGVARMADPAKVAEIAETVSIPVMAKARIGHFVEAQVLESLGVDYIDESEVLTPADEEHHIDKWAFTTPFVCGARDLGEALRRIGEGAAMIRTKGEAGTGNVVEAVRHMRAITGEIRRLQLMGAGELMAASRDLKAPYSLVREVAETGALPVVNFAAGGIATPADATLMMQLGCDGVFVGSGIFKSEDPAPRAKAIVEAVTYFEDPAMLAKVSRGLGEAMPSVEIDTLAPEERLAPPRLVTVRVGVLALQGDFREHAAALQRVGADTVLVRTAGQLDGIDALVVPGGESTTIGKLADRFGLLEPIREAIRAGLPAFGTCAGMIFLARGTTGAPQIQAGVLDVVVERNAFGRQNDSFEADLDVAGFDEPFHAVFIRAPWIAEAGPRVEVLAAVDGHPVVVREDRVLAASFHPELTGDDRFSTLLLDLARER